MKRSLSPFSILLILVLSFVCSCLAVEVEDHEQLQLNTEAKAGKQLLEEQRVELGAARLERGRLWEVPEYNADSGGCTPMVNWEQADRPRKWWMWGRRMNSLAVNVHELEHGEYMKGTFWGLGNNAWMQFIDGWTHPKGRESFGDWYIEDLLEAAKYAASHFGKKRWLTVDVYTQIHQMAFSRDAGRLGKRNGYRLENSGIYLPLPDKPLGVFHDIHNNGKMNYDPSLRKIDVSPYNGEGWKYNGGRLYRWVYPGVSEEYGRNTVATYFQQAWDALEETDELDYDTKLNIVVTLYHRLENFHCFVDGNGRTNYVVLQAMLSEIGLHPVLLYNLMESALSSVEEERQRVIEGFFKWEEAWRSGQSGWTVAAIEARAKECELAIAELMGKTSPRGFVPDTLGGCMCIDVSQCNNNKDGWPQCNTKDCTWGWDYCAPGRSSG